MSYLAPVRDTCGLVSIRTESLEPFNYSHLALEGGASPKASTASAFQHLHHCSCAARASDESCVSLHRLDRLLLPPHAATLSQTAPRRKACTAPFTTRSHILTRPTVIQSSTAASNPRQQPPIVYSPITCGCPRLARATPTINTICISRVTECGRASARLNIRMNSTNGARRT